MLKVRKAIVLIAGLGTRFLPLSKVFPKELWPLVDIPTLQYIIEETWLSGIEKVIFVNRPEKRRVLDYFKKYFQRNPELEEILKKRKRNYLLKELKKLEKISKKISFAQVFQKVPLGASHAILSAEKFVRNEPCAVLYGDDIVESKVPCLLQLIKIFEKYQKPIVALYRVPQESFPSYGMIEGEKIDKNLYKIKRVVEKPSIKEAPSDLAIVGKHIITPEVFEHLKKTSFDLETDISLSQSLSEMAEAGENIYGYEFEGKWLECGNKLAYLKSNFYLSLKHPQFGKELKEFLKKEKLV